MLTLGIETATTNISVALLDASNLVARLDIANSRRHVETLVPAIDFLCGQSEFSIRDIGVVAVDVGPGLFTGLRVGIATAVSIAYALQVPVVPIGSLHALAVAAAPYLDGATVMTVLDARRREVYAAVYSSTGDELVPPFVSSPIDACALIDADTRVVGEGATRYADIFVHGLVVHGAPLVPDAVTVARLGAGHAGIPPDSVEPLYLRAPDAQLPSQRAIPTQ